jgi:methanethiol oxidase
VEAPPENFAYTLLLSPDFSKADALAVIDVKPGSSSFSQVVHTLAMPYKGGVPLFWLERLLVCNIAATGQAFLGRRYLIIPDFPL